MVRHRTLPLLLSGCLLLLAAAAGRVHALASLPAAIPLIARPDDRPVQPVVELDAVQAGVLTGRLSGDVRVVSGSAGASVAPDGTFRLSLPVSSRQHVVIDLPTGAQFFASRKGKVYYDVRGKGGSSIKPENRVYFTSAAQAEAAGYRPPK